MKPKILICWFFLVLTLADCRSLLGQQLLTFQPTNSTKSELDCISENGQWAVGLVYSNTVIRGIRAKRDGTYKIFALPSAISSMISMVGITDDGQQVLGYGMSANDQYRLFIWVNSETGDGSLTVLPIKQTNFDGVADGYMNSDGTKIGVTLYDSSTERGQAARYDPSISIYALLGGTNTSTVFSSVDRVVGTDTNAEALGFKTDNTDPAHPVTRPTIFNFQTGKSTYLDTRRGEVWDRSSDLKVYVGVVYSMPSIGSPFRWLVSKTNGQTIYTPQPLGSLGLYGGARSVSSDGNRIVGDSGSDPFIWEPATGIQNLNTALANEFHINTHGMGFNYTPICMSKDGSQIVGLGRFNNQSFGMWADLRQQFNVTIAQGILVSFPTILGLDYEIFESTNLTNWTTTGVVLAGTGNTVEQYFNQNGTKYFYRVSHN